MPHGLVVPFLFYNDCIGFLFKFRIHFKMCAISFRTLKDNQPAYLANLLVRPKYLKYLHSTNSNKFVVPRIKTKTGSRAFSISGPAWSRLWHMITLRICAPMSLVRWGYRRYRSFFWLIDLRGAYNCRYSIIIACMQGYNSPPKQSCRTNQLFKV